MSEAEVWQEIQSTISDVLLKSADPTHAAQFAKATATWQAWEEKYFAMFVTALAIELGDDTKGASQSRLTAGILLRTFFVTRDVERREFIAKRWATVPVAPRQEIKSQLWKTLASPVTEYRHTSASAIAAIAILDLATDTWKEVVPNLAAGVSNETTSGEFKEGCLIALADICIDADPRHITPFSFDILLAILTAMSSPHVELQLSALKALANAVQYSESNFDKEDQRNPIMSQVMEMAKSANDNVRLAAFDCLVSIAVAFYKFLPEYMRGGLKDLTLSAISAQGTQEVEENIVKKAIEFWSVICEEERNILRENLAAQETGAPLLDLYHFVKGAAQELAEPLFACLTKGDVDLELATWTISAAAATCISLMANTLGDEVVQHFVGMVSNSVNSTDELMRDAAMLCFGSILDGPRSEVFTDIVNEALSVFFTRLTDESPLVRRTTAWCLSRLAKFHPSTIVSQLGPFLEHICASLSDTEESTTIASFCAEAIDEVASHVTEDIRESSPLVPFLGDLFQALVVAEEKPAAERDPNLRISIFSAIRTLIQATPDANLEFIDTVLSTFVPRLRGTLGTGVSADLQGELVGIISACILRLGEQAAENADDYMRLFLDLLQERNGVSSIYQDVFIAAGNVSTAVGEHFLVYMNEFGEFLNIGLQQYLDVDLCTQSINVVSALCFSLGEKFAPYCPSVIKIMKEHFDRPDLPVNILGPVMISAYSDIVYVLGPAFSEYLGVVLGLLDNFMVNATTRTDSLETLQEIDETNAWRTSMLQLYIQIIQYCAVEHSTSIQSHLTSATRLLTAISEDSTREDETNRYACGLIYDLASNFPNRIPQLKRYENFLNYCKHAQSSDERTVDAAVNAIDRLNR